MDKFNNKYRIPSARLNNWDYGTHGLYFITICTKDRECYFGEIEAQKFVPAQDYRKTDETQNFASLHASTIGERADKCWQDIPKHFPFVELDEYVVMPNHVHGILFFNKPEYEGWKPNKFAPQSKNLASVIRGYKVGVKAFATANGIRFEWQPRYYDHIINAEKELNNIRQYIYDNPMKWELEKENVENLMM